MKYLPGSKQDQGLSFTERVNRNQEWGFVFQTVSYIRHMKTCNSVYVISSVRKAELKILSVYGCFTDMYIFLLYF
jgi:hypothetical protein